MPTRAQPFRPPTQRTSIERKRDADRGRYTTPWRKWYKTAKWQAIRERQLSISPLCIMCLDDDETITSATVCDHITPHRGDEDLFWSGPFQSLCAHHHNGAKQREEHKSE
jgi:5-methylcytosine-specific restriction protein A